MKSVTVHSIAKEVIDQMAIERVGMDPALRAEEWKRIQASPRLSSELWARVAGRANEMAQEAAKQAAERKKAS